MNQVRCINHLFPFKFCTRNGYYLSTVVYRPFRTITLVTFKNKRIFLFFLLQILTPIITTVGLIVLLQEIGKLLGNEGLVTFVGLFTLYPLLVLIQTVIISILILQVAAIFIDVSFKQSLSKLQENWLTVLKWGILASIVNPFIWLGKIIGRNYTAFEDMSYTTRKGVFYGLQMILLDEEDSDNIEELFINSNSKFQGHFGQVEPSTGLSIWFRRVSLAILVLGVVASILLIIITNVSVALFILLLITFICTIYLHYKHLSHTFLYLLEEEDPSHYNPESRLILEHFKDYNFI